MGARSRSAWLLLLMLLALPACSELDWQQHTPPDGGFVVELPAFPQTATYPWDTPAGELALSVQEVYIKDTLLQVAWTDLPPEALANTDTDQLLDQICTAELLRLNSDSEQRGVITGLALPNREVRAVFRRGDIERATLRRLVLQGNRLYRIVVVATPANLDSPLATRFLNSFQLTG